ncbi:hypothetical protein Bsp3421_004791 [Burkholderia sp. FERM BP-3421]|uniref:hypothetical protein n=1 Tax=Burkholderia sp. FERM BP-3421 TaxID=1494466 RepID=UPI002361ABB1|nr:hypothetical protein [Burkholderia sp. FERM BP-3421]WDD94657.1 hypothetical protein Bsp3421_004791 [Burkholderia sp. FERM BP-3421]
MGQKFAAFGATGAIITFYDSDDSPVPSGVAVIEITDQQWQSCLENPGYTVSDGALVPPAPPTTAEVAAQELLLSAQSMFSAGIAISSTSTPALNGTYACDQLSQMDIIAIETSINAGKGFPGGATTFNYPDVSGVMHAFSEANFTNFAAAVRNYVYALKSVIAGVSTTLPSSTAEIA